MNWMRLYLEAAYAAIEHEQYSVARMALTWALGEANRSNRHVRHSIFYALNLVRRLERRAAS